MPTTLPPEARARRQAAERLLALLLAAGLLRVAWAPPGARTPVVLPPRLVVDLAHDPVERLMALPGFGRARAEALVRHREAHGPPRHAADLDAVPGLGPTRVRALLRAKEVRVVSDGRPVRRRRVGSPGLRIRSGALPRSGPSPRTVPAAPAGPEGSGRPMRRPTRIRRT